MNLTRTKNIVRAYVKRLYYYRCEPGIIMSSCSRCGPRSRLDDVAQGRE